MGVFDAVQQSSFVAPARICMTDMRNWRKQRKTAQSNGYNA